MKLRLVLFLSCLALVSFARAGEVIKNNATGTLNLGTCWDGGAAPGPGDVAVWHALASSTTNQQLGASLQWAGLKVISPGIDYTIRPSSGFSLTLGAAGVDMSNATRNFTANPTLNLGASQTWTIPAGRTFTAGALSGSAGFTLTKAGDGNLALTGAAANFAGGLAISGGTVQSANGSGTQELSGPLFGAGTLSKTGAGTLTLSADNTGFSGLFNLTAGQLNLSHPNALGESGLTITGGSLGNASGAAITLPVGEQNWNGDFAFAGTSDLDLGASAVTVTGSRLLTVNANTLTVSGLLGGSGGLTKAGTGTLRVVTGADLDLTGKLAVTGGPLKIEGGAATCGAAFEVGGTGVMELNGGVLMVPSVTGLGGSSAWRFNGGVLRARGSSTAFMTGLSTATVRAGGAGIDPNGHSITVAQPLLHDAALGATPDGGLVLTGGGTLTLTGASTYTGPTVVTEGSLVLGTGGGLAASPVIELAANGSLDGTTGGTTLPAGQTLTGVGQMHGELTIGPGATLAPGETVAIGTLGGDAILTLGGNASFRLQKLGGLSHDAVVAASVKFGGTLTVTATGTPLAVGDSFKLFAADSYSGSFTELVLPALPPGWFWDTAALVADGTLTVLNTVPAPTFTPPAGGYFGAQSVTISSVGGATIFYTTDGTDPTTSPTAIAGASPLGGVVVPAGAATFTLKAYAAVAGATPSPVVTAVYHILANPVWTFDGSGTWSDPANWQAGAVAAGTGITADFSTLSLSGDVTVSLDSPRTIGNLRFGDLGGGFKWALSGSSALTLDAGGGTPFISVANQSATIGVPVAGTQGWVKNGPGTLTLSAGNSFTGGVTLTQGRLVLANLLASGNTTTGAITVNGGSNDVELEFTAGVQNTGLATASKPITVVAGAGTTTISFNQANSFVNATLEIGKAVTLRTTGGGLQYGLMGRISGPGAGAGNDSVIFSSSLATPYYYTAGYSGSGVIANTFAGNVRVTGGGTTVTQNLTYINATYVNGAIPDTASVTVDAGSTWLMTWGSESIDALRGAGNVGGGADGVGTLTVGAGNGGGEFAGVISSVIAITKTGTGTQKLSGANTYTGATTINGGSLIVNGSLAAGSAVTVAAGILGGSGNVAGPIAAAGTLAPGDLGAGTLTVGSTTLTGSLACQLDGTNCDKLAVAGNLTLTGSTLAISTLPGGATQGSYVIASHTGTRTGTFATVTGLPVGYAVDYTTPNQIKLVGPAGFSAWVAGYGLAGGNALPTADPDRDGIANSVEFVLGGNPATVMNAALLPTMALVANPGGGIPDGNYLKFTYRRTPASAYLNPGMEYDADLTGIWTAATSAVQVVTAGFYATPTPADKVDVYVPRAGNQVNGKLFGRLRVTIP